eukprot:TRINITY_DN1469_c0_g1_i1.p1 TRINITY_DN1469_c0_g1~~TRINITY_DN1469_c0_g1_i1.p1  ORF type:complete len:252 (-),score=27.84 TRINITY_DN1469_c0_g1_i1:274-1029(-)
MNQADYPCRIFLNPEIKQRTILYKRIKAGDEFYTNCPYYICIERNQASTLLLEHEGDRKYVIKVTCKKKTDTLYQFEDIWDTTKNKTLSVMLHRLPEANNSSLWTLECFYLNSSLFSVNLGSVGQKQANKHTLYLPLSQRIELYSSFDDPEENARFEHQDFVPENPHEDLDIYFNFGTYETAFDTPNVPNSQETACQEDDLDIEDLLANIQETTSESTNLRSLETPKSFDECCEPFNFLDFFEIDQPHLFT